MVMGTPVLCLSLLFQLLQVIQRHEQEAKHSEREIFKRSSNPQINDKARSRAQKKMTKQNTGNKNGNTHRHIKEKNNQVILGATVTAQQIMDNYLLGSIFPDLREYLKLVSSTPIRNMGTLAGNLVNASPIGDLTIFFMALDAELKLMRDGQSRRVKLKDFYQGYKELDLAEGEIVTELRFAKPGPGDLFNFEKVSKRTNLDIASVNSAMSLSLEGDVIAEVCLSAGGVAATPLYLYHTSAWLKGKTLGPEG